MARATITPIREKPRKGWGPARNVKPGTPIPGAGFTQPHDMPLGFVEIDGESGEQLTALLGDGKVTITGGYGGWEQIDRPRKKSITSWQGTPPFTMTVPVRFEGFIDGLSVEDEIAALEQFGRRGQGDSEPPVVRVQLPGGVPRSPKVDWVVENIEWDADVEERGPRGHRTRAAATITLLEHVADELIRESAIKKARTGKGGKPYKVKKGDSLKRIAQHQLGDADRWKEIAKLNGLRGGAHLKQGRTLKMPPKAKPKRGG